MALHVVGVCEPSSDTGGLLLGATISKNESDDSCRFIVPAHVLTTMNVVCDGEIESTGLAPTRAFATGPQTTYREYVIGPRATIITVFLRTDYLRQVLKLRPLSLVNQFVDPSPLIPSWEDLQTMLAGHVDALQMARSLLSALSSADALRSAIQRGAPLSTTTLALSFLQLHASPRERLSETALRLGLSERSIQRAFRDNWGVSAEFVKRLLRVNTAMKIWPEFCALHGESLSGFALELGLQDQAHLAKEFRELVGFRPSSLKETSTQSSQEDVLWALHSGQSQLVPMLVSAFSKTSPSIASTVKP